MNSPIQRNALVLLLPSKTPRPDQWIAGEKTPQRPTPHVLAAMALEHPGMPGGAAA